MKEKLTLENIAPYLPYGLKLEYEGNISEMNEINILNSIYYGKPILRLMDLAKPIIVEGKEIIPIVELYNLSQGIAYSPDYHRVDIMSSSWVCIDKKGHWLYNFRMFTTEIDVRLGIGYGFESWTTDLRNDNKKEQNVNNQNLIFQWLFKHKFDVFWLIEKGLSIDVNTLEINPYN